MAKIAEAFMMKVTAGLDEALAKLDNKIADFTTVETPQNEKLLSDIGSMHHHIEELHDEIQGLLNEKEKRKEAEKVRQDDYDRDHLFKSAITTTNPKTIHELYEEMDLLDIDSDDDDQDSGNEMDDDDVALGEDEIIFLGKIDQPTRQKRSANEARLTPPCPPSRPAGAEKKSVTVSSAAAAAVAACSSPKAPTAAGSSPKAPTSACSIPAVPAAAQSTLQLPQTPSIPSAQKPPKAPLVSQVPIGQATATSSSTIGGQTVPAVTKSMVVHGAASAAGAAVASLGATSAPGTTVTSLGATSAPGTTVSSLGATSAPGATVTSLNATSAPGTTVSSLSATSTPGASVTSLGATSAPGTTVTSLGATSAPGTTVSSLGATSAPGASVTNLAATFAPGATVTILQQPGASNIVILPPGLLSGQLQGSSKTFIIQSSMLPGLKNLQSSKLPLRYRMVSSTKNEGQELNNVKQLVLEKGVTLDGKVVLKTLQGQQQQQPVQIQQFGQPLKVRDASKATMGSSAGTIPHTLATLLPVASAPPMPKAISSVVEIEDEDDDIVMLSSTPATGVAKKSTTLRATARAPSAVPGHGGSPGKVRQGVQLIHGGDYDHHLMEGEEIMFGDDDATLPELVEGKKVLAKGEESFWYLGTLIGPPIHHKGMKKYKVKFEHGRKRLLSSKFLAVLAPSKPGDLAVGIRVVASYLVEDGAKTKGMYAGIIAEVPMKTNKGRYLVFFDDGYAQYLSCDKIHIVYHSSACVWADVDIFSRDFIREYLDKYPDRSMVNLKRDQVVTTEWNGKWWNARVLEVQGSLANMLFEATASRGAETEWIYRGSTRLKPLLDLGDKKNAGITTGPTPDQVRLNLPYVEMTKVHSDHILPEQQIPQPKPTMLGRLNDPQGSSATSYHFSQLLQHCAQQSFTPAPSFAKKSTASVTSSNSYYESSRSEHKKKKKKKNKHKDRRKEKYVDRDFEAETSMTPTKKERLRSKRYEDDKLFEPETKLGLPAQKERLRFIPHECSPICLGAFLQVVDPSQNSLLWPMDLGWVRELGKQGSNKRYVIYRTPCGKSLYSFGDISRYLKETKSAVLSVDRFSFDSYVHISFNPRRTRQNSRFYYMQINDLSKGVEKVPVSCVNEYDIDEPPSLVYMTERQAVLRGSKVNTDPNFLICCDCTDDCADASKCACRQLTIEASTSNHDGKPRPDAGYKNRLLFDQIQTGIYECNDKCKCSKHCKNKVVQNGLSLRLQVFKTYDRGWGIRCLDDIPKGMFVCTYAGQIWDEEEANQKGKDHGDEYFAELDYIEIVEKMKEGYESDVDPIDEDMSEKDSDDDSHNNNRTQSSSDEDFQTAQSELSSDDSADMINPVPDKQREEAKESTNQKEQAGGGSGTKLVLRRQSESTEESQWSVSLASQNGKKEMMTPPRVAIPTGSSEVKPDGQKPLTMKYGYDPSPSKEILDQKQVAAFRQRRQAAKEARARQTAGGSIEAKSDTKDDQSEVQPTQPETKSSGADRIDDDDDDDIEILAVKPATSSSSTSTSSSVKAEEDRKKVAMETDENPDASVSDSLQELDLREEGEDKDGIKNENCQLEDKEKKPVKSKVTGPRARKSTNSRMRQRFKGSPGASSEPPIAEKNEMEEEEEEKRSSHPNTRSLFGEKHCYVMDAKNMGNLGRYLNHSCRPNLFVQNVFVDSHDLRFPWVAFFAAQYIRAGSELNWDYMYEVGCVPGKEIRCLCKNADCRGRLL